MLLPIQKNLADKFENFPGTTKFPIKGRFQNLLVKIVFKVDFRGIAIKVFARNAMFHYFFEI